MCINECEAFLYRRNAGSGGSLISTNHEVLLSFACFLCDRNVYYSCDIEDTDILHCSSRDEMGLCSKRLQQSERHPAKGRQVGNHGSQLYPVTWTEFRYTWLAILPGNILRIVWLFIYSNVALNSESTQLPYHRAHSHAFAFDLVRKNKIVYTRRRCSISNFHFAIFYNFNFSFNLWMSTKFCNEESCRKI